MEVGIVNGHRDRCIMLYTYDGILKNDRHSGRN